LAIMGRDIPAIHYSIAGAGGATIRCAPYELFGTQALADRVLEAMEGRRACLLAHHGMIAAHVSIGRALALAVTVEELAQLYLLCLPAGTPPVLTDAQIEEVLAKYKTYGQQGGGVPEGLRHIG